MVKFLNFLPSAPLTEGEGEVINLKLQFYCLWNLMICQRVYLQFISVYLRRFQGSKILKFKYTMNITMKVHNLKALYPERARRFFRYSEKFAKLQGERPWWSTFLIKFQIIIITPVITLIITPMIFCNLLVIIVIVWDNFCS